MSNLTDALEAVHDGLLDLHSRTDAVVEKAESDHGDLKAAIEDIKSRVSALEEHLGESLKAVADRLRSTTSYMAGAPLVEPALAPRPISEPEVATEPDVHAEPEAEHAAGYKFFGAPMTLHSVTKDRVMLSETGDPT